MSVIDGLVTDRMQADADRCAELSAKGLAGMTPAERTEYLAGMKGAYNAADLNRVTEAMEYVAGRLRRYGYTVELKYARSWSRSDIPTPAQMAGYLADLSMLRGVLSVPPRTPGVPPDMDGLTWREANDIEKILVDVDGVLKLMAGSWIRCGSPTAYSAQRGLPTEGRAEPRTWAELDALGWGWAEWDMKTWTQLLYEGV